MPGLFFWRKNRPQPPSRPAPDYDTVRQHIEGIEAEMKRIGLWSDTPPHPEQFSFKRGFAGDTMAFDQWLQYVFIANVRAILDQRGQFPASSSVGSYAVREWDGSPFGTDHLIDLLIAFDRLF